MSIRHKAYKEPLDKGYSSEWNDDHIPNFEDELMHFCDFIRHPVGTCYDTAETTGGTPPIVVYEDTHTWVKLNTGAVTGNTSIMRHKRADVVGNITNKNDLPILITAIRLQSYHTANKVFEFGFLDSAVVPFTPNQNGAYFRVDGNDLKAVTGNGSAETITSLGAPSEYKQYKIEFLSTQVKFYVGNMTEPAAIHTTNIPTVDLTIKFAAKSQNNINSIMKVDGVALVRLRKK